MSKFQITLPCLLLTGLFVLFLSGCGKTYKFVEVTGTVTSRGKPLENILISFLPDTTKEFDGPHSTGITDKDGRFQLKATNGQMGAVVGWHSVVLEDLSVDRPAQGQPQKNPSRISLKYSSAASTSQKIEVVEGKTTYEIKLD